MTSRRWFVVGLAAVALVLLAGRALATLYIDYRWYQALGATEIWRSRVLLGLTLRVLSFGAATLFVFANLYAVRQSVVSLILPRRVANLEIGEEVPGGYLMVGVAALAILLGALLTLPGDSWTALALLRDGIAFGESDPYFTYDLGFYVYWLPFETTLFVWALIAVLLVAAVVTFLYALTPSLRWERGTLRVSTYVRRHLAVLAALLLLVLAWHYRLAAYGTLMQGSGADGAFTYVDHKLTVPASLVLSVLTLSAAVLVAWSGWAGQVRVAIASVVAVLLVALVLREFAPTLIRRAADEPDPAVRERPYLGTRAGFTRRAYAVDRIAVADPAIGFRTMHDAARGVPVWDAPALIAAVERTRRSEVASDELGWRMSPTGLTAYAPERPPGAELERASSWTVTSALAIDADESGAFVRVDSAGRPAADDHVIDAPIVFDSAGRYLVVPDSASRIAAPEISSGFSRLAHAWSLQNFRLLFDDQPQPNPRMVRRRGVRERVAAIIPFFALGSHVAPVVLGDSLFWTLDFYSASATYPLSRHVAVVGDDRAYFQHAGTAVVNAATGRVILVRDSVLDPIALSWVRRFPALFRPVADLPPALVAALPPPADGVRVQADAFARVGTRTDAGDRTLPAGVIGDSAIGVGGPTLQAIPGLDGPAWVVPVLDREERVSGMLLAPAGGDRPTLWLPVPRPRDRWSAVLDALQRTPEGVSPREAGTVRGTVRVFPVAGGIAYAQPVYLWRGSSPPTLARMVLLEGDSVRVGRTLADAVGAPAPGVTDAPLSPVEFRARAAALFEAMRAAQRRGDWAAYGQAFDALGRLLGRASREP